MNLFVTKNVGWMSIPTACCHSSKSALDKVPFFSASLLAQLSTSSSVACFTSFKDQEVATSTCSLSSAIIPEDSVKRLLQNKQNLLPASPFRDQTCLCAPPSCNIMPRVKYIVWAVPCSSLTTKPVLEGSTRLWLRRWSNRTPVTCHNACLQLIDLWTPFSQQQQPGLLMR